MAKADCCWPDHKTLNVKLLFDMNNFEHDPNGIRRISRFFESFKRKNVTQRDHTTGGLWKGILLHSQELERSLNNNNLPGGREPAPANFDPNATFCSQIEDSDATFCTQIENRTH